MPRQILALFERFNQVFLAIHIQRAESFIRDASFIVQIDAADDGFHARLGKLGRIENGPLAHIPVFQLHRISAFKGVFRLQITCRAGFKAIGEISLARNHKQHFPWCSITSAWRAIGIKYGDAVILFVCLRNRLPVCAGVLNQCSAMVTLPFGGAGALLGCQHPAIAGVRLGYLHTGMTAGRGWHP